MDNDKYIGRLLDNRYEVLEVIGVGGMAVVYKARCHRLNRLVAIKILKDDYCQDEEFRRRFHAEGQAVAMVSHPNIVSVYDVSTSNDADYIVMELIDGISLKQYMEKKGVLNWKETLHFAIQIGKALEHAHSRGIVHRDIKPHNVMVLKNGSVKVADFGIARVMSESNTLTREALGSVHYISPEQAKGGRVDDRSDIYSLGVVMYEMITGRPPYNGESPVAVAIQHINGGACMPSVLNPNIPGGLEQIIMKAMALEPGDRYASVAAMLYDMDEFRKLPSILFDYHIPPIDEVTKLQSTASQSAVMSTAQRVAAAEGRPQLPVRRTPAQSSVSRPAPRKPAPAPARKPAPKRRTREEYEDDDRSKIATIAIIACSLVAIVAIVVFLITLFGNGTADEVQLVTVTTLVGKNYDTISLDKDLVLDYPQYKHDDTYEKGLILEQTPAPGDRVVKGTIVRVTVSLGPEPQVKTMENLVNQERTTAENFLNGQGFTQILFQEESSDTVKIGCVTRTDPEEGTTLTSGQTITLYISTGPSTVAMPAVVNQKLETAKTILNMQGIELDIVEEQEESESVEEGYVISTKPAKGEDLKAGDRVILVVSTGPKKVKMPSVTGKDLTSALELLEYAGFTDIDYTTYVESDAAKDTVVNQSHEANTEVPVNTKIVLELSEGPKEPEEITKTITINLPEGMTESFKLSIKNGEEEVYVNEAVEPAESVDVELKGIGTVKFEIQINDIFYMDYPVDFTDQ